MNKVLIGVVTYSGKEYCLDKFMNSLKAIIADCSDHDIFVHTVFFDTSDGFDYFEKIKEAGFYVKKIKYDKDPRVNICNGYNRLRLHFLQKDYTHMMCLEQDVMAKPDIVRKLLGHDKQVCSGWYDVNYHGTINPCVGIIKEFKPTKEEMIKVQEDIKKLQKSGHPVNYNGEKFKKYDYISHDELKGDGLIPVYFAGLGAVLIKRDVMHNKDRSIYFTLVEKEGKWITFNDMQFYHDLGYCKITPYVDCSLYCEHDQG